MVIDFQIKEQYEQYGRTPDQIAEEMSLDPIAVKAKLLQVSDLYRKSVGSVEEEENPDDFTKEQLRTANQVIYENMLTAVLPSGDPDYRTRQRAAEYIRDDKKGRKELKNLLKGNQFNILNFNEALQSARSKADEMKQAMMPKTVEV